MPSASTHSGRLAHGDGDAIDHKEDETEADLVGMELAARAGYDPRSGVTLWQKMSAANKGAPPQWLSTHPSGTTRIKDIETNLPKVMPLYERSSQAKAVQ